MLTIQELLFNRGLPKDVNIKLVRHKDQGFDLYDLYKRNKQEFYTYQSQQGNNAFDGLDYIVSFIGEEGTLSRFIGVFKILSRNELPQKLRSLDGGQYKFEYGMEEVDGFEELRERVIIDWGKGALQWCQWIYNDKEVVQIHPGLHYKQFTDYYDFILNFDELREILKNQYKDWKQMLTAVKGVYLISDTKTGKLYVGSAYNEDGIWGRWGAYVATNGHGNNKSLKELIQKDEDYARNFQFSLLMTISKSTTNAEIISKEQLYKRKLGTNAFGLNNN